MAENEDLLVENLRQPRYLRNGTAIVNICGGGFHRDETEGAVVARCQVELPRTTHGQVS